MDARNNSARRHEAKNRLALDRQLCVALYSTSLAMTKLYRPLLEPLGLIYPQHVVMLVLWERDDLTLSELGERLLLDSGTLTPLPKRLESVGLLQRHRDAHDERRIRRATAQGASAVNPSAGCISSRSTTD